MKKITIYHCMLPIVAASFFCLTSYIKQNGIGSNDTARNTMFTEPLQLTTEQEPAHIFVKGEILLPDYTHTDTLQVIAPDLLNEEIPKCSGTDQDIYEILAEGCINYLDYPGYIATVK